MSGSRTRACVPLMNTHPRSSGYLSSNQTRAAISANPSRQLYGNGRLLADLELRDLVSMHFVWAIGKPKGTGMRIGMGKAKVLRHAGTAVRLDGPVDHLAGNVGRMYFDHGDLFASSLVASDVHLPRRAQHHVAGSINHDPRVRNEIGRAHVSTPVTCQSRMP